MGAPLEGGGEGCMEQKVIGRAPTKIITLGTTRAEPAWGQVHFGAMLIQMCVEVVSFEDAAS